MEGHDGLGQVEVELGRVCSCLGGIPFALQVLHAARRALVRGVIAIELGEGEEPVLEGACIHQGGALLPGGADHALAEVDGESARDLGELDDLGHLPNGAVVLVQEAARLGAIAAVHRVLEDELRADRPPEL